MTTYRIERVYRDAAPRLRATIKTGLTLEQAQAHCRNPQTSSKTCTTLAGKRRTKLLGPWFDSYNQEQDHETDR